VDVTARPPLLLAPANLESPGEVELRCCLHAALWIVVDLEQWQVRRSGHLHLVREANDAQWREVDLARHPLRPAPGAPDTDVTRVEAELRQALAARPLQLFRIPDIGVVSEIGEGRDDFRRRATGMLRPELQRRVAAIAARSSSRLPWRRRAAERRQADDKARLAAELATLGGSIETIEVGDLARHVRRAEIGLLLVAPGVRLEAPRHRALMI
jgi:hypothetical protein